MSARQEWLTARSSIPGVGASESSALFGLHPYLSAFSLFEKLVNPKPPTDEELEEDTDVKSFGLAIEPYLAGWYQRKTGRLVDKPAQPIFRLRDKPHIFASPDMAYIVPEREGRGDDRGPLELKSAIFFNEHEPLPDHWQVQGQQQTLCTNSQVVSYAILGGFRRRYHVDDIPRNDAFCAILVETIDRFMHAVRLGSWNAWGGEIEGSKATTEALKRLYPHETGATVNLPEEACEWADMLAFAKDAGKDAERQESQAKNKLMAAIGNASFGVLPDGRKFSLKTTKGSTFTVTKADHRVLRLAK